VLKFLIPNNVQHVNLDNAYLFGADGVPLRAEIQRDGNIIQCEKRAAGPAGLGLVWNIPGVGSILVETVRVPERNNPYHLTLELARGQLMRLQHKREDWGLLDCPDTRDIDAQIADSCKTLVEAMKADDPDTANEIGLKALTQCVLCSDRITAFHADVLLERRKETAGFSRHVFGCEVDTNVPPKELGETLIKSFDFVTLPMRWKDLEPKERVFRWKALDAWADWVGKNNVAARGGGLLCLQEDAAPDWLRIWENDFETIRGLVTDHVRKIVNRYGRQIQVWDVISGVHAPHALTLNFEQLMELTRIAAHTTRQLAPRATTIIDLVSPWGEYYARNPRTIPPMLYADMAIQSGINFDAFGLRFCFGRDMEGRRPRDMFQISALLDRFGALGRPIHVTGVVVPSAGEAESSGNNGSADGGDGVEGVEGGVLGADGSRYGVWNETTQARWLRAFYEIALSKPFVETVCWEILRDGDPRAARCGLLTADNARKKAFEAHAELRREISPNVTT
jgi:hypothetical protein